MTEGTSDSSSLPLPDRASISRHRKELGSGILFILLCAVIILAPLPLGSARPLAWSVLGVAIALLLIGSLFVSVGGEDTALARDLMVPCVLFAMLVAFVFMQAWAGTPIAWHNPIWDQAVEGLGRDIRGAVSIDPEKTLTDLTRLISYAGVFFLSFMSCRDPRRARSVLKILAIGGSIYAAYGLIVYWSGSRSILWLEKWAYPGDVTATFVNRNSFATYLGLSSLATIAYLIGEIERSPFYGPWRHKLSMLADFIGTRAWLFFCLFILVTALTLTHSRGGFVSTFVGIFSLLIAVLFAPGLRHGRQIGWATVPIFLLIIAFFISGADTTERILDFDLSDTTDRFGVYELLLKAIGDYPISGTGLGSFESVFPLYRTAEIRAHFDLAHNDYLQNILELGIPGALCLFALPLWLFALCGRGIRARRRDAVLPCVGIGATILVGFHATVDFSLQIPAVTVTYMFLMGAAVAQSRSSRDV